MGFLPEESVFHGFLSCVETMELFGGLHGLPRRESRTRGCALLERLDLGGVAARRVRALSHGMRRRLALATALIVIQASGSPGVRAFYNLVVNLSTMTAVVPYAFCALAGGLIGARAGGEHAGRRPSIVEVVAFVFAMFTLYGCGPQAVLYGFVLLLLGIPVYVWQRQRGSAARPKPSPPDGGGAKEVWS